jgi:hypothetical protein
MSEDYYDVAWVNYDKAILHGTRADGTEIERVLTDDERERVYDLSHRHEREKYALLRELSEVTESA